MKVILKHKGDRWYAVGRKSACCIFRFNQISYWPTIEISVKLPNGVLVYIKKDSDSRSGGYKVEPYLHIHIEENCKKIGTYGIYKRAIYECVG